MDKLQIKSDVKTIALIDQKLARYLGRLAGILDDIAALGADLQAAADKEFTVEVIDDARFLRSCGYKLAEEGLCLTRLIISRIVYLGKKGPSDDVHRSLNDLADDILETYDPFLHNQIKMLGPYRH